LGFWEWHTEEVKWVSRSQALGKWKWNGMRGVERYGVYCRIPNI
jgi:hypothetical protein